MRIIDINVLDTYSCDECGKWFKSEKEYIKDPPNNFFTICSKKCEFKFIYNLVKKQYYSEQNLMLLSIIIGKGQKNKEFNRNEAIYELSKYYNKVGLSNITYIGSRFKPEFSGSKSWLEVQRFKKIPPIYNRGLNLDLNPELGNSLNFNNSNLNP